jgi:hypothetical protein
MSNVARWLALLPIPGSLLVGIIIDETEGPSLEDAPRGRLRSSSVTIPRVTFSLLGGLCS